MGKDTGIKQTRRVIVGFGVSEKISPDTGRKKGGYAQNER